MGSPEDVVKEKLKVRKNAHVMLVEGMSKLTTHNVKTCQSSDFHMYGLKWNMEIRPAGSDGKKNYLSFYVRIEDTKALPADWDVECTVKFMIIDQTAPQKCHSTEWDSMCYSANNVSNGIDNFISHTKLKNDGYLVNDKAFFSVEISNVRKKNFTVTDVPRTIGTSERLKLIDIPRNKSRFTWKITQFSSFDGDHHYSYEFTAGPRRWKIDMYPKGYKEEGNPLSLYLVATDYLSKGPKAKTLAVYKLRILDQLHRNHYEEEYRYWFPHDYLADPLSCSAGRHRYMSHEDLTDSSRGFLVNDQIYIGVEFLLLSTTEYL